MSGYGSQGYGGGQGYGGAPVGGGGGGGSAAAAAAEAEYGNRGAGAYDSLMRDSGATFIADPVPGDPYGAGAASYGNPAGYGGYGQSQQPQQQMMQQPPPMGYGAAPVGYGAPQQAMGGYGQDPGYGQAPAPLANGYGYGAPTDNAGAYDDGGYGADDGGYGAQQQPPGGGPEADWSDRLYSGAGAPKQSSYAQMFREGQPPSGP
jgi:hypothetical protein